MGTALLIRGDLTPEVLRRRARHEANRRTALRMLAIANALEGMSRAEAARLVGMERQALPAALLLGGALVGLVLGGARGFGLGSLLASLLWLWLGLARVILGPADINLLGEAASGRDPGRAGPRPAARRPRVNF